MDWSARLAGRSKCLHVKEKKKVLAKKRALQQGQRSARPAPGEHSEGWGAKIQDGDLEHAKRGGAPKKKKTAWVAGHGRVSRHKNGQS